MKKTFLLSSTVVSVLLLVGCGNDSEEADDLFNEGNGNGNEENVVNEVSGDEEEVEEDGGNEEDLGSGGDDESEDDVLANHGIRELTVEDVYVDAEKVDNEYVFYEYDERVYVPYSFVGDHLGYDITFDSDSSFMEIFDRDRTYYHEMIHDGDFNFVELAEIWQFNLDTYTRPDTPHSETLFEYGGELYISQSRLILNTPSTLSYDRSSSTLVFNELLDPISVGDLDYHVPTLNRNLDAVESVTFQGNDYGSGIEYAGIGRNHLQGLTNYSRMEMTIINPSSYDLKVSFQPNHGADFEKGKTFVEIPANDAKEFTLELDGSHYGLSVDAENNGRHHFILTGSVY